MVREGVGDVDELLGLALMRKVLVEIFGCSWDIVIEENLGGLGLSPLFFTLSIRYMLISPSPITVVEIKV